jgi:hypothetical protein
MKLYAIGAAVASVALLAGCASSVEQPAGPTDEDALAFAQQMLDDTYVARSLYDEKLTTAPLSDDNYDTWSTEVSECLSDAGYPDLFVGWGYRGYEVYTNSGSSTSYSADRAMYRCVAGNPLDARTVGMLYTDAQREYLWDYYSRWQLPCLKAHRIVVENAPTEDSFMRDTMYLWAPYDGVNYETLMSRLSLFDRTNPFTALEDLCGPRYGVIQPLAG